MGTEARYVIARPKAIFSGETASNQQIIAFIDRGESLIAHIPYFFDLSTVGLVLRQDLRIFEKLSPTETEMR